MMKRQTLAAAGAALAIAVTGGGVALAVTGSDQVRATCTPNPVTSGKRVVAFDVHCSVPMPPPVTVTATVTQPAPATSTTSTTVPVPTTTTTTATATATSPTPAPVAAHGRDVNASNAGIAAAGLTKSQLTPSGSITASTPGQVIEGKLITGSVNIRAKNVTLRNSWVENSGSFAAMVDVQADGFTMENTTLTAPGTSTAYMGVWVEGGTGHKILHSDISRAENLISLNDSGSALIEGNYLHNAAGGSGAHKDSVEVYAGKDVQILGNRIEHPKETETAAINVAPWSGASSVDGLLVADNYIDGGHMHFVLDKQSTGVMRNIRVLRNDFGGHTTKTVGGSYWAFNVVKGVSGQAQTDAEQAASPTKLLLPESGPDVNHWVDCSDLSPNRTGQVVTWAVSAR